MAVALEQFVKQLEDSGILAGDTLKDFLPPTATPKDAEALARELVRHNKLTKFQAEEVYRGKAKSLVLGNYILMEKIGAGGMGQVFKAEHRRMHRIVAVKVLPPNVMKDKAAIARFEREVTAAAKINHPNIVAAYDADCENGIHFLVMECIEGNDLSALVKKNGPFAVDQAVNYILQAATGLEAAHAAGIVHRDIKPANLLLDKKGVVKILDMGLARLSGDVDAPTQAELTSTGTVMGTVDYMAPEQALNTKTADHRADIYALGCSLYYLLAGKATYDGDTLMAKLLAHRDQSIPSLRATCPEVSDQLEAVFKKMVAKTVQDRYQTMTDVIADLERCNRGNDQTVALQAPVGSSTDVGLTDFFNDIATALPKPPRKKKATKPPTGKGKKELLKDKNKLLMIGGGILAVLILMAALVVKLKTKDGTLIVTVNEPDAEVQVLNEEGKVEITRKGEKEPLTIAVDPGKHRLKVTKQGFEFFTQEFSIESGGKQPITAKLVPLDEKSLVAPSQAPLAIENSKSPVSDGGWKDLFDGKSLTGWTGDVGQMTVENGVLVNDGKRGTIIAPGDYQDVEIEVEFRLANGGNSGLGICYGGSGDPSQNGLEVQMLDDEGTPAAKDTQRCGSIYMLAAAKPGHFKRWPEWNKFRVTSTQNDVRVELNGVLVTDTTRSQLKQANSEHVGVSRLSGMVCLFPHTGRSEYRSFRIRSAVPMPAKPLLANSPAFQQWMRDVAALPAEQQVEAVSKKLVELNPGFDGKVMNFDMSGPPWIEIGVVKQLGFISDNVTDISPLRALVGLTHFNCGGGLGKTKLANLSPLKDMKLSVLVFSNTQVSDLSPLEGMPLTFLNCDFTLVSDFSPLKDIKLTTLTAEGSKVFDLSPLGEMPLTILNCGYTRVSDLSPLKNMKLAHLCCWHTTVSDLSPLNGMPIGTLQLNATRVTDLSPLRGMKLTSLHVDNTAVSDLSPLKGMPLTEMHCGSTQVTDLSPLHGMRLKVLNCDFNPERDTDLLRSIKTLETIKKKPAAEFWKEVEEQQKGKKIGFQMPGFDQWIKDVAAMPAEKQVEAVAKKLVELNPGFDGKVTGLNPNSPPKIENGVVTELQFFTDNVSDISPVRALTGLKSLECRGSKFRLGQLTDLSPLKGLPLSSLNFAGTNVSDLTPVKDLSSLRELIFYDTPTADL